MKANTIGRPFNSVAMHSHMEFLITMEAALEHPEKTLSEIVHDVYTEMRSDSYKLYSVKLGQKVIFVRIIGPAHFSH